ncbi:SpoIID/LytB domain-containing protein [Alteribacillus sp. YIM 98480]|uniref:SpoIID/LytB domain-containing protein n=1 Tax=Alteribacillus sp. YIM 98480 TaxID=2606599 RepID=UPI00131CAEFA|nr:SpoIID/LytB domain-containing protein [Alteribacillus sp. YIM 98480]
MYKKMIGALLSVPLLAWSTGGADAAEPQELYNEPMTIKLVPSSNFNVNIHGSYELIDLEDGESVEIDNDMQFRYGTEKVTIKLSDDVSETSSEGYVLQEDGPSSSNYVSISSVERAGTSFQETNYRGSFIIEPEEKRDPSGADDAEEQNKDNDDEEKTVDRLQLYNVLDLEDYLKGVVPHEMSASWPSEALKAQAVAARNYGKVNMDANDFLYDTVTHQVYHGLSGEASASNAAIRDTEGLYAVHNGSLIYAYFHASSGGYTDNSENVWSSKVPYIRAVDDPYDNHSANSNTNWTVDLSREDADEAIFPSSNWELTKLEIIEKSDAGRVQKMRATGSNRETGEEQVKTLPEDSSPDSLRWSLGTTLKSTMFDVSEEESSGVKVKTADGTEESYDSAIGMEMRLGDGTDEVVSYENLAVRTSNGVEYVGTAPSSYTIEGKGYGHGLGMSQWGAYKMAQDGHSFREILKHYYTDIDIVER